MSASVSKFKKWIDEAPHLLSSECWMLFCKSPLKQHNIELILLVVLWLIAVQQWNPMMAVCVFIFWSSSTAKPEMASPSIPKCRAWRILGKSTTVLPSPSPETGTVKWMYCKGRSAFCLSAAGYFRCHSIYFNETIPTWVIICR